QFKSNNAGMAVHLSN
ncbi:hypothetical protein THAOC_13661, partial [Thalassiosira oceanica]